MTTAAVYLAFATGGARANDWPQLGLDAGRARASQELSGTPFQEAWRQKVAGGPIVSSPMVADGYVVVAASTGELRALQAHDGAASWSAQASGPLGASPAIDRGRIFVPTLKGRMQAFALADGHVLWQQPLGGQNYGSPAVVGDSLVVAAGFPAQEMVRVAAATGAVEWRTAPGAIADLVSSSPAVAGAHVVFGMNGGRFQSVDATTGSTHWTADTVGSVGLSAPLVVGNVAYMIPGGKAAALYASDVTTGQSLSGWPVAVADPAPPTQKILGQRVAVSSPVALGALIAFEVRFEYDLQADADGSPGLHRMREYLAAVDPASAALAFVRQTGSRDVTSINEVPELNLSPTPAVFASAGGPLVAVASSISPTVRVLDAAGNELWNGSTGAPTRSSPTFANGMLYVATDAGEVRAFQSAANRAPLAVAAGFVPASGDMVGTPSPLLRWGASQDDAAGALHYRVRIDADGELLANWLYETETDVPAAEIPHGVLQAGGSYVFAVRSRDAQGAWSEWSAPQAFQIAVTPKVEIAGTPYNSLDQAIAAAPPGSTINIGAGVLRLAAPVQLSAGLTLVGAGAHDTILDASGLGAGVQVSGAGRSGAAGLQHLTVANAEIGVQVIDTERTVVRNVVLRDNRRAGIQVEAGASAELINATAVANGKGAVALGTLSVRNSIVTGNDVGLSRSADGALTSRYDDVYGNTTAGYEGSEAGLGDLAVAVRFRAAARHDFRLEAVQPTTDRGDPQDDVAQEPMPNAGRVNLGAFGGTAVAELSGVANDWSQPDPTAPAGEAGCSVGGSSRPSAGWLAGILVALVLASRRRGRRAGE